MGVRLTIKMKTASGTDLGRTVVLDDEAILFGRDESCQVVLAQQAVSRNHARITRDGPLYFLEDLGSIHGTQVNNQKIPKGEKRLLSNGDLIAIAQFDVVFDRVTSMSEEAADGSTSVLSRKVIKDVMKGLSAGGENAYFRVMNGANEGQHIEIANAQEYIFGRDASDADVVVNDDLVSRKHVKVRRDWSGTHVEDLGSRNGIRLNKKRIQKVTIKDRDELEIGNVRLLFIDPSEVREAPVLYSNVDDEIEGTHAVSEEEVNEAVAEEESVPEPEPEPEVPAQEEPPAELQNDEEFEESFDEPEAPPTRLDLRNKQHVVVLSIGIATLLVGIVLIVLIIAGA
jgi:pSer/pThr/pTyr-binding forkhead associated (FHA) protein